MTLDEHYMEIFKESDIKRGNYVKIVGPSITGSNDYKSYSAEVVGFCPETNNYEVVCKLGYGIFSRDSIVPL